MIARNSMAVLGELVVVVFAVTRAVAPRSGVVIASNEVVSVMSAVTRAGVLVLGEPAPRGVTVLRASRSAYEGATDCTPAKNALE
jgi:hypothetical protein